MRQVRGFAPTAKCDVGLLRYRLKIPAERPALRMRVKGFRNFGSLHEECSLGRVAAQGQHEIEDVDTVTGSFTVQAVADVDATVWKKDADKLLEHIRRIMSFAAASLLGSPIIEFFAGDTLEGFGSLGGAPAFGYRADHSFSSPGINF